MMYSIFQHKKLSCFKYILILNLSIVIRRQTPKKITYKKKTSENQKNKEKANRTKQKRKE